MAVGRVAPLGEMMLDIVRSYPPTLRRWVDVAAVTRVFSRALMSTLAAAAADPDDPDDLWDQLVALPFVERRPNTTYALHETVRRPLLADLRLRDRDLFSEVASDAYDFFADRADSSSEAWSADVLDVVYYDLLCDPDAAMDGVDELFEDPAVRWYPTRRSAVVAVVLELADAELLEGEAGRRARTLRLEELLESGQPNQVVEIAAAELGADAVMPVHSALDARIAVALGLAHAQLNHADVALSLYRGAASCSGLWAAVARLREGNLYADRKDDGAAEQAYVAALEQIVEYGTDNPVDAQEQGLVHVRRVTAWTVHLPAGPTDLGSGPAGEAPSGIDIFIEGDRATGPEAVDLVALPDGRVGVVVEPLEGFGILWLQLAELYVRTGRLDDARSAAELGGRLAEIVGDHERRSQAFNLLARIGVQRGDREFRRTAVSADRELAAYVMQTGEPHERLQAALRLGWSEVTDGHLLRAAEAFEAARTSADELGDGLSLASALLGSAEVARQDQRTDDAVSALQAAMAQYQRRGDATALAEARHRLGDLLIPAGRPEPAREALEAARRYYDESEELALEAEVRVSLARTASLAGDYPGADEQLDAARSLAARCDDDRVRVSVELGAGDLLTARFEFDAAAETYRAALAHAGSLHPDLRAVCHLSLGAVELNLDRRRAVGEFERAARIFGQIDDTANEIRARGQQAVALSWLRDDSAVALAEQIVEALPAALDRDTRAGAYIDLATVFERLDRHGDALEVLSSSVVAGFGIEAAVTRLNLLAAVGRFADVLAEVAPLLEHEPYRADLHALQGWCLLNVEPPRFADAEASCVRARSLEPDNPWHPKDLARCLLGQGRTAEAVALARGVVERLTGSGSSGLSGDLLALAGFAAYVADEYDRAEEYLTSAMGRDPLDFVTDLDRALVELCSGAAHAADHYARVLSGLRGIDAGRRRGIIAVAVRDVEDAVSWGRVPDRAAAQRILDLMCDERDTAPDEP